MLVKIKWSHEKGQSLNEHSMKKPRIGMYASILKIVPQ